MLVMKEEGYQQRQDGQDRMVEEVVQPQEQADWADRQLVPGGSDRRWPPRGPG